jgi:D-lactate dehydrogenase
MKIAIFSAQSHDKNFITAANANYGYELQFLETQLNPTTAILAEGFDAVCAFVNDNLNSETLHALAGLGIKLIALRCAGFNQVDLPTAKELGITVVRVPAYSPEAVAEHAMAMILTLNRKTHKAYNRVREGNFSVERLEGFNLHGKTVGVIGLGKIGLAFARIAAGFGCKVIAYDKILTEAPAHIKLVSMDELLANSTILSIHCPLTPETHHLLNETAFAKMQTGAMLINTSRGGVLCTKDVIEALKTGKIGYLGIDVYEQEEKLFFRDLSESVIQDDMILRLQSFPNVLITAHQGFFTHEALTEIAHVTLNNIADEVAGKVSENRVV